MADLSRIGDRAKLKSRPGDEPHWQRLRARCFLGYRPSKKGGPGTWFARVFDEEKGRYVRRALGDFGTFTGHEIFTAAKRAAEMWANEVESGGVLQPEILTVRDACEAYLAAKPGSIAEGVFRRHVYSDPIARVRLDKLRRRDLRGWRERLENAPAAVSRNKHGEKVTKARSASTVNRDMVPLRAALNRVLAPGTPSTEEAWQEALKPIEGANNPRTLYLDIGQRRRLLDNVDVDARPFVRAMCMLPLRPGALAKLLVRDFEPRTKSLMIGKDKNGRPRLIAVPTATAKFLNEQCDAKKGTDPIFARTDGAAWCKDKWKYPIKDAVTAAKLPAGTTAYTIRHSVITDLVMNNVPILAVAKLSGTSVQMIEQHYGHLVRNVAEEALGHLAIE